MPDKLDQRILALMTRPLEAVADERDLAAALLAVARRQPSSYSGRRDLFALEKRVARLTKHAPLTPDTIDAWHEWVHGADKPERRTLPKVRPDKPLTGGETLDERIERLLNDPRPRATGDLDLADAIVAILWRQLRQYRGDCDLWEVEQALNDYRLRPASIEPGTIIRLASREFLVEARLLDDSLTLRATGPGR